MKTHLFVLGLMAAVVAPGQQWNHDPNSPIGPNFWGYLGNVYNAFATCGTSLVEVGKKQTPVNLTTSSAIKSVLPEIDFLYGETPLKVRNTLHVVEVEYEPGSEIRIGPSLPDKYTLLQFHFHAPGEHTVDGHPAAAELHLVHQNALGELAVVGVLLKVDETKANPLFDKIIFGAPIGVTSATDHDLGGEIDAKELLPKSHRFYTYTGSLTTPPCTEGVHWFVLTEPVAISAAAVARLHHIIALFPGYNGYPNNNRPLRGLNGRSVLTNH